VDKKLVLLNMSVLLYYEIYFFTLNVTLSVCVCVLVAQLGFE